MKFKIFRLSIKLWDLLVTVLLLGYLFSRSFRGFIDALPYLFRSAFWLFIVLFFYYSIISWVKVILGAIKTVLERESSSNPDDVVEDVKTISEDSVSDDNVEK